MFLKILIQVCGKVYLCAGKIRVSREKSGRRVKHFQIVFENVDKMC